MSDDETLTAIALAADPDEPVDDDAVCFWNLVDDEKAHLLPDWYMPRATGGMRPQRGWRRRVALLIIAALVILNAYGLCSTYGPVVIG